MSKEVDSKPLYSFPVEPTFSIEEYGLPTFLTW